MNAPRYNQPGALLCSVNLVPTIGEITMGIDYGNGMTNVDQSTGLRFGVISMHEVTQTWCDESESEYGEPQSDDCVCPNCGCQCDTIANYGESIDCPNCDESFDVELPDCADPIAHSLNDGEYKATQSNDDSDIFILKSPYYAKCAFCSPCAPGAGYLMTESDECKAYCFGHDWFENGIAPYTIYSVLDDSVVKP